MAPDGSLVPQGVLFGDSWPKAPGCMGGLLDSGRNAPPHDRIPERPSCYTSFPSSGLIYDGNQCSKTGMERASIRPVARFEPMGLADGHKLIPDPCSVTVLLDGKEVPALDVIGGRSGADWEDACLFGTDDLRIMLLLQAYHLVCPGSLHSMFNNVPLAEVTEEYMPQQAYVMDGPYRRNEHVSSRDPCNPVRFDARMHPSDTEDSPGGLRAAETRQDPAGIWQLQDMRSKIHRPEAFKALRDIPEEVSAGRSGTDPSGMPCLRITADELSGAISRIRFSGDIVVAMGLGTYRGYLETEGKDWQKAFDPSLPCPLLDPVNAVAMIDPIIDEHAPGTLYAINRQYGARYAQGPILAETGSDGLTRIKEYFEYAIVDKHTRKKDGSLPGGPTALRIVGG